ncbi:MAG: hypothetical protein OXM87_09720 [Truepera sp.]|nr:hypothetical protein [Truepera sp.]
MTYQLYTICYDERYEDDVAIVKEWIDAALELGRQKYGVARPTYRGRRIRTTVFMPSVPSRFTYQGKLGVRYDHGDDSVVRAELYYFTPSAWSGNRLGGLGIPAKDYHPHYVMHEMTHVVQYSFPRDSKPPAWIIEGIAEYDGFFHTTEYNRTTAIDLLIRHVHRNDREKIFCCLTLDAQPGVATTSIYYGGAVIMTFLAERFGEGIHAELFTAPLAEVLERRGTTVAETYRELRAWFEQRVQALGETPWTQSRETPRTQPPETPRTQPPETPRIQLPEIPPEDDRGTTRVPAGAECDSRFDSDLSRLNWASVTYQFYTICYDERYKSDVAIVKRWLDATLELGRQKYSVARPTYRGERPVHTTVFMPSVRTASTSEGDFGVEYDYGDDSVVHAELYYFTPSAWDAPDGVWGRLSIPLRDYHPHFVVHEMAHVVHRGVFRPGWWPPTWISEGIAEYDGFFYSTRYNRTTAIDSLIRHVHKYDREKIFCCRTLGSSGIATTSIYSGGGVIMLFLAERFGEGIHVELLTTPLTEVLEQRGTTVGEMFGELRTWFQQRARALNLR